MMMFWNLTLLLLLLLPPCLRGWVNPQQQLITIITTTICFSLHFHLLLFLSQLVLCMPSLTVLASCAGFHFTTKKLHTFITWVGLQIDNPRQSMHKSRSNRRCPRNISLQFFFVISLGFRELSLGRFFYNVFVHSLSGPVGRARAFCYCWWILLPGAKVIDFLSSQRNLR